MRATAHAYLRGWRGYDRPSRGAALAPDLPGTARMIEAARLKARASIALADCFAVATAAAHGLTLLTGDPELLELVDAPCRLEDLRPA